MFRLCLFLALGLLCAQAAVISFGGKSGHGEGTESSGERRRDSSTTPPTYPPFPRNTEPPAGREFENSLKSREIDDARGQRLARYAQGCILQPSWVLTLGAILASAAFVVLRISCKSRLAF
jgi:hypothetical protein